MSTDTTLASGGTDVFLGSVQHTNPLASGSSYTASATFTLPADMTAGNYYLIVVTNATGRVYETDTSNDALASSTTTAVTVAPTPDLTVSNVTVPSTATSGGQLSVGWTVTNAGGDTGNVPITDSVYLSFDQVLDPNDRYIGSVAEQGGLAAGASYTQDASISLPPGVAGTYYVIVETNSNDQVAETNTANNTAFAPETVQINLQPEADLVAGTVTIPANALAGQDITISYQVTNAGGNPADGSWVDSLYLSPTPTWSVSDPLLGRVDQTQDVAPGGSYTGTLTAPVPGVTPGSYYVILRTNILDTLPESTLSNNQSVSLTQTAIDATPLTLGTTTDGALTQGQYAYYKVDVTADQTLAIDFTSQTATTSNELYVSYGTMPTRSDYDFSDSQPLQSDQTITVPNTQAGTYYILAYGNSVPGGAENYTLTASIVPFSVSAVTPAQVDNGGPSTLEIQGALFDRSTTFQLIDSTGHVFSSTAVYFQDSSTVYATFDLTNESPGALTVQATASDGSTSQLVNGVAVVKPAPPPVVNGTNGALNGALETYLVGPTISLPNRIGSFTVTWVNTSGHDLTAPLLEVTSPAGTAIGLTPTDVHSGIYLEFLGVSTTGPAGILRPGESVSRTLYFQSAAEAGDENSVQIQVFQTDDSSPIDLQPYLLPSNLAQPNFPAIYAELQQSVGSTWGDYIATLAKEATLLPAVMGDDSDPMTLLDLAATDATSVVDTSISGIATAADPLVPIAGQVVYIVNQDTGDSYSTYTLNDGSFVFPQVTPGTYTFMVQGEAIASPPTVTVASGQALQGVALDLVAAVSLSGTASSFQSATPIAGATIQAVGSDGGRYTTTSDGDGQYLFQGLPPDTYTLIADALGFARTFLDSVVATSGDVSSLLEMAPEAVITGSVSLAPGGPTGGLLQVVAQPVGVTDPDQIYYGSPADDNFSVKGLPAGDYSITISLTGYGCVTLTDVIVTAGATANVGVISLSLQDSVALPGSGGTDEPNPGTATVSAQSSYTAIDPIYSSINGTVELDGTLFINEYGYQYYGATINAVFIPNVSLNPDLQLQYQWVQTIFVTGANGVSALGEPRPGDQERLPVKG